MSVPPVPPPRRSADAPQTAVELPLPRQAATDPEWHERRRVLLRQLRARRAMSLARRSAVARTAVLLRSISYPDQRR
ncbi:hypothetical protein [Thermasporomyces composti]|nr:hypothetical protein [Thermasporomyces composti]